MSNIYRVVILLIFVSLSAICSIAEADKSPFSPAADQGSAPLRDWNLFLQDDRDVMTYPWPGGLPLLINEAPRSKQRGILADKNEPVFFLPGECLAGQLTGNKPQYCFGSAMSGYGYDGQFSVGKHDDWNGDIPSRGSVLAPAVNSSLPLDRFKNLVSALKEIFVSEGIPHDLIWLVEVESSLNPKAESPAGAVGLFQLMPATAQRFGLRLFPVDERNAPNKSAKAAACYLRYLRNEFGCWQLALAAYNAGEGRVSRTMKQHDARTFNELAPHLPAETRRYVLRVMTTMALREDQMRGIPAACFMP